MKKTERINTIMRYMNNRSFFTISEIMREFNISRSTAIRDIREIEAMGMPLEAEVGRDGGYSVMNNSVLPSIRFTDNEVKALFIAFLASRNQQLPYLKSRQSLAEKLLGLIPDYQQDNLVLLNQVFLFEGTNPNNPDLLEMSDLPHPMLEKLIELILLDHHLLITVRKGMERDSYSIFLLHLYREKSVWHIEGFDLMKEERRIFLVDQLTDVQSLSIKKRVNRKMVLEKLSQQVKVNNLVIELGPKAIAQFKKYHPFNFSLSYTHPYQATAVLETFVNVHIPEELKDITNWILFLGEEVKLKKIPGEVLESLRGRLSLYD